MKIVIIETYYEMFLKEFYEKNPGIGNLSYGDHLKRLMATRFSVSDAFSYYFKQAGWEACEIVFNDSNLQAKWARENGVKTKLPPMPLLLTKGMNLLFGMDWRFFILKEQIKKLKPDVILIKEQSFLTDEMARELRSMTRMVAMQVASKLLSRRKYTSIDLVVTSFPHFVEHFQNKGLKAHFMKLCFDPRILSEIQPREKKYPLTFVGGISFDQHQSRNQFLENVAEREQLDWFGYKSGREDSRSSLRKAWRGNVWGLDMYQVLADSQRTLNIHSDIADHYANNTRLYEATGMGTCLITDQKKNMKELFEPDTEVITYENVAECLEKISYLKLHPEVCAQIAKAGQTRTLKEHTFEKRVLEMSSILKKYL